MSRVVTSYKLVSNCLGIIAFLLTCFAFFAVKSAFALDSTESGKVATKSAEPKKTEITYPVATLGNCADKAACKTYCEDPVNKDACVNFAKSKGFYKEPPKSQGVARSRLILEKAKSELGCSSEEECKELCAIKENADKCKAFAEKYKLNDGRVKKVLGADILDKAKTSLGCNSKESCDALCKKAENHEKCSYFAKAVGLQGGMVKIASVSGKQKAQFDEVKRAIDDCKKDPKKCEEHAGELEKKLSEQSDEFCRNNPGKCKEASSSAQPGKLEKLTDLTKSILENNGISNPDVQGVSISRSIISQIFHLIFK